jgi:two-component system nitrate/nitrite response regulator NarL
MAMRLLIVDDHAGFRVVARRLLSDGFDVVGEATDGAGAFEAVRRLRPQVVLLDVQLPDLDGFQVAETLAGTVEPPAVVLVSSRARSDYGGLVDRSSALGFIPKAELTPGLLLQLLRTA